MVTALQKLSFQLSGTQLGITITSLVVGMLAEPALAMLLTGPLIAIGMPRGAAPGVAVVIGMLAASAVQMVIGELVPKNWAVSRPMQVARMVAGPQQVFSQLLRPMIEMLNGAANRLVRMLGVEPADELASARTPTELVSLARHSARAGAIEEDTADLFVRSLNLGELTAQSVMTARVKVSALDDTATAADVLNLTRATGLSRFPVYRERLDEVVGMVHLKDALAVPAQARDRTPAGRIAVPPLLVPGTLPVQPLLERLRSERGGAEPLTLREWGMMKPGRAYRGAGAGDRTARREASVYVRTVRRLVRDVTYVSPDVLCKPSRVPRRNSGGAERRRLRWLDTPAGKCSVMLVPASNIAGGNGASSNAGPVGSPRPLTLGAHLNYATGVKKSRHGPAHG